MQKNIIVRVATSKDAEGILEIRNDPLSRQESLNTESISLEKHVSWFNKKYLQNNNNHCFVLEKDKLVIGYCRLDLENNEYIVSIAISPDQHGNGFGTLLLSQSLKNLNTSRQILATVKKNNPASLRIFEKNGFVPITEDSQLIFLKKS